jgi:adenosylhomocysteine nucleosidase
MAGTPIAAAILAALSQEVRPFLRRVMARRLSGLDLPAWEFVYKGKRGVAALSGMGERAAEGALARLLAYGQPQSLISLGFAGALTPELPPGALVVGESFRWYDPAGGEIRQTAAPPCPAAPGDLVERLRRAGLAAFPGTMVSTPGIIHKARQGGSLLHVPHPVLDLETHALAQVAQRENLPFLALRAITDAAEEEIPEFLRQAAQQGRLPTAGAALAWLAADPRRVAVLVLLWRRSRLAAARLAQALEVVWDVL